MTDPIAAALPTALPSALLSAQPTTRSATPASAPARDPQPDPGLDPATEAAYRRVAREFESVFLAEMLKHTGLGRPQQSFGGGAGEAQFAPMLAREQAEALAARGGIGLADQIFRALVERDRT